jgi:hypothetical protein
LQHEADARFGEETYYAKVDMTLPERKFYFTAAQTRCTSSCSSKFVQKFADFVAAPR